LDLWVKNWLWNESVQTRVRIKKKNVLRSDKGVKRLKLGIITRGLRKRLRRK